MNPRRHIVAVAAAGFALGPLALAGAQQPPPAAAPTHRHDHGGHGPGGHADHHGDGQGGGSKHLHAPVPGEYRNAHVPAAAWTHQQLLARGKQIYATRCAVCHGVAGGGDGPAAEALPVKPANFRDAQMVAEMAGNYWFWRVSEGGAVEPFRSMGSVMPAWKEQLSVQDRWAVIAWTHRLSGHEGPHVTSEHPEMLVPATATSGGGAAGVPAHKH